jgi:biopolymer transport protein TolQ
MSAFRSIGTAGSASLAVVAPGIAESLIATAIGLLAAIPAVIAYNYYLSRANRMIIDIEDFSEELVDYLLK